MRLSEHRRRPSHSSFRRADGNQLCLQQINSITPPVDLVFFKTGGWTVTEWLPRIFNHLFTRWSLVRTYCIWSLICSLCYFNLQWDLNPRIHSLVQGAALATCVWGLFHTTILQILYSWAGRDLNPRCYSKRGQIYSLHPSTTWIPVQKISILTHTMEKSASQYNWLLVIILFVEYNIIQFSLYSFTTLPI